MTSGIYKIENKKNGRVYIGSALNVNERRVNHFSMLRNNSHTSIILQRAYNKTIDKSVFQFEVLEYCDPEILIEKENYYLNLLCKSQDYINGINKEFIANSYNILPLAKKGFSGRHRPETIEKFSLSHPFRKSVRIYKDKMFIKEVSSVGKASIETGLSKNCVSQACKSKRYITKSGYCLCFSSDLEDLESKLSTIILPVYNRGYKYSPEEMSKFTYRTKVKMTNLISGQIEILDSQMDVCRLTGLQPCTINRCLKLGRPYRKKLKFEYYKDIV